MSWKEKIERYKTEQQQGLEETARLTREAKLRIAKEKIPPLLEVLKQLRCEELLVQIGDEVWKLGEVSTTPDINTITPDTPIVAKTTLQAEWLVFVEAGSSGYENSLVSWNDHLAIHKEALSIVASREIEEEILIDMESPFMPKYNFDHPKDNDGLRIADLNAPSRLEERLVYDCIERQRYPMIGVPYDQKKLNEEDKIVGAIIKRGFRNAPQYLLDRARKLQR